MSADDILLAHLRTLAARGSWRAREFPAEITEDVLRALDERRCIEFRLWEREGGVVRPNNYSRWFSPRWQPHVGGNLEDVLNRDKCDLALSPELRVSEAGKGELSILAIRGAPPPAPSGATSTAAPAHAGAAGTTGPAPNKADAAPPNTIIIAEHVDMSTHTDSHSIRARNMTGVTANTGNLSGKVSSSAGPAKSGAGIWSWIKRILKLFRK